MDLKKAQEYAKKAFDVRPAPNVQQNIDYLGQIAERDRVVEGIKVLAVHLLNNKELIKLRSLVEATPYWFRETEDFAQLEAGAYRYTEGLIPTLRTVETPNGIIADVSQAFELEKLLLELDKKYENITIINSPFEADTVNVLSQTDMERLIMSGEGRHIKNLQVEGKRIICEYDRKIPQGLKVRFYAGRGFEDWNPKTIRDIGCGGSETSMAIVAREMAAMGHHPIIYAMDNQVWDGVLYRKFDKFSPESTPCNIFISSRVPDIFYNNIPAEQKWLWVHDISCWNRFTPETAKEMDAIIALSHWHAEHLQRTYPFLKDAEVWDFDECDKSYDDLWTPNTYFEDAVCNRLPVIAIIGDAIDTTLFENIKVDKVPHRFVWCSSPDRGLEHVLELWPLLKKELPDAELKIFYGWNYFDATLWIPGQQQLKEKLKELIKQDGVEWCNRVGQTILPYELGKAQCMLYPPPHDFRETYGIAFLEAQAAGVIVFYRQNGALGETVDNRGVPLSLDLSQEQIVKTITDTLSDTALCDEIQSRGREYGMQRSWKRQAEKMVALYERLKSVVK